MQIFQWYWDSSTAFDSFMLKPVRLTSIKNKRSLELDWLCGKFICNFNKTISFNTDVEVKYRLLRIEQGLLNHSSIMISIQCVNRRYLTFKASPQGLHWIKIFDLICKYTRQFRNVAHWSNTVQYDTNHIYVDCKYLESFSNIFKF